MNLVTGCSGIDAIALAATLLDIELIGQIEIDKFCNEILELRFPGIKQIENIFDVRGDEFGTVDIFAFGDPCQPHSVAGKQKGTADERYIWPEIFRIIKTMRPTWIINENVTGSVSNGVVLNKINDLESAGYRARAFVIPACSVGAPHQRYRVFIVGYSDDTGSRTQGNKFYQDRQKSDKGWEGQPQYRIIRSSKVMADTKGEYARGLCQREGTQHTGFTSSSQDVADTTGEGFQDREQSGRCENEKETGTRMELEPKRCSQDVANSCSTGREKFNTAGITAEQRHNTGSNNASGCTRTTQPGMGGNVDGIPDRLHEPGGYQNSSRIFESFEDIFTAVLKQINWPAGYGAEQYEYEPPRVATGVKTRSNRLKALGNAIVPWQIFPILLAIKLIND